MTNGDWRKQIEERLNNRLRIQLLRQETLDLRCEETRWLLIDLLDRDSQKKPTLEWGGYTCPSCCSLVWHFNNHCDQCGQKLGWREG